MSKRTSTIPMVKITAVTAKPAVDCHCIKCGKTINPGMSYTGSVLTGLSFYTRETPGVNYSSHVELGHTRNVAFFTRKKGPLCDSCASDYHTVVDFAGRKHPIVMTDARPGFIGLLSIPVIERHKDSTVTVNYNDERKVNITS